jgi:hypothetical protein
LGIDVPEVPNFAVDQQDWNFLMVLGKQLRILVNIEFREFHMQAARHLSHGFACGLAQVAAFSDQQLNLMQSTHLSIISRAVTTLKLGDEINWIKCLPSILT